MSVRVRRSTTPHASTIASRAGWLLPCLLAPPMLLVAQLTGRHAVLFPEALALAFGVWVLRRPEMLVSRWRIAVLPTVCAAIGVAATRAPGPRWVVAIGVLSVVLVLLQLTRCRVAPALSAAVLPVVFDVRGPEYLIMVVAMCALVAVTAARPAPPVAVQTWPWSRIAVFWASGSAWIALAGGVLHLPPIVVAPPVLVAALEFVLCGAPAVSGMRRCVLIAVAGCIGAACLLLIPVEWVAGTVAAVAVAALAAVVAEPLAPALAIALVPFVAGVDDPLLMAAGVGAGAVVLHLAAWASLVAVPQAVEVVRRGRLWLPRRRPA